MLPFFSRFHEYLTTTELLVTRTQDVFLVRFSPFLAPSTRLALCLELERIQEPILILVGQRPTKRLTTLRCDLCTGCCLYCWVPRIVSIRSLLVQARLCMVVATRYQKMEAVAGVLAWMMELAEQLKLVLRTGTELVETKHRGCSVMTEGIAVTEKHIGSEMKFSFRRDDMAFRQTGFSSAAVSSVLEFQP